MLADILKSAAYILIIVQYTMTCHHALSTCNSVYRFYVVRLDRSNKIMENFIVKESIRREPETGMP
jgi:hypothetical protein